jgi:hypothetical protein
MTFYQEPTLYHKTALSDLQGAWQNLREAVLGTWPFPECDKLMFHINEAMSWESVRNLDNMRKTLLVIHNIAAKPDIPEEVREWVTHVRESLDEVFAAFKEGEL